VLEDYSGERATATLEDSRQSFLFGSVMVRYPRADEWREDRNFVIVKATSRLVALDEVTRPGKTSPVSIRGPQTTLHTIFCGNGQNVWFPTWRVKQTGVFRPLLATLTQYHRSEAIRGWSKRVNFADALREEGR
jgi:hypothetical protein